MQMEKITTAHKEGSKAFGLYSLALSRLEGCEESKGKIIPFPKVFEKICRSYQIKKKDAWEIIYILRDMDKIEVIAFHGVRIK